MAESTGPVTVRIEHAVPDFARWQEAFASDPADRRGSGVRRYTVSVAADDANFVLIDLDFDDEPAAAAFLARMRTIWAGPGRAVMIGPQARIVRTVESTEL